MDRNIPTRSVAVIIWRTRSPSEGKYAEAEAEYRAVLKLREKVLGPEHPDTLASRNNLAGALYGEGKYAEAEAEYRAVLKLREKVLGPEHPDTLLSRNDLAWFLATCPDAKIRNGSEAMALATNVCELSRWSDAALSRYFGCRGS